MRRRRDRYMLAANSRSSSKSCVLVKAVRILLLLGRSSAGPFTSVGIDGDNDGNDTSNMEMGSSAKNHNNNRGNFYG